MRDPFAAPQDATAEQSQRESPSLSPRRKRDGKGKSPKKRGEEQHTGSPERAHEHAVTEMIRKLEESRLSGSDAVAQQTIKDLANVLGRLGAEPGAAQGGSGGGDGARPVAIDTGTMHGQAYRDFVKYQSDLVRAMIKEQHVDLSALQYFQERWLPQIQTVRQSGFAGSALTAKRHTALPSFGARNVSFDHRGAERPAFERRKYVPVTHIITQVRQEVGLSAAVGQGLMPATARHDTMPQVTATSIAATNDTSRRDEKATPGGEFSLRPTRVPKKEHWTKLVAGESAATKRVLAGLKPEPLKMSSASKALVARSPIKPRLKKIPRTSKKYLNEPDF